LAKSNYQFNKRQKELARKKKKEEKRQRKLNKNSMESDENSDQLPDEEVLSILTKLAKQHRDSITEFKKGNRDDLVKKEEAELAIVQGYLPKQLSREELNEIVNAAIKETGAEGKKAMGAVIKTVMAKTKGQADGKIVSEIVNTALS